MWLARRFILRQIAREPVRACGTALGVALGIAVIVAIRLANASSVRGFEAALETMAGQTSLEVVGPAPGFDEDRLEELGWLRDFGVASPVIEGEAMFQANPGRAEMLRVLGVDILRDRQLRDYEVLELGKDGRTPTAQQFLDLLLDPRAIIVTERFARRYGLSTGDALSVMIGDAEVRFVIGGRLRAIGPARALDGNVALMDIAAAQWAFGRLGRLDRLDVRLHDPAAVDTAERDIAARLPGGLRVQRPAQRGRQVERMLAAFHLNLTALSFVALLVGLFLVYNTVSISVVARREEIGVLRALGVGRRAIVGLFLGEGIALALVGCVLGVALGRLLAWGAVSLTATTVNALYLAAEAAPPDLGAADVLLAFAVGVPLSLLAAAVPAAEASRVTPVSAIRGADRIESRYRLRLRFLVVPAVLFVTAAWLGSVDPIGGLPLGGFGAALALVLGAASLVPAVLFVLGRFGRRVLVRLFGVEGLLANGNLAGAIPRLAISVAALAVSLSMMVAIAVMIGSFRQTVIYWVEQTLKADLYLGPLARGARQQVISPEVESVVAAHPAVAAIDRVRSTTTTYSGVPVALNASDFDLLLARGTLLFKSPVRPRDAVRGAIGRDAVIVSESFSIKFGAQVGGTVQLTTLHGVRPFRVAAVFYDYSSDRGVIVMNALDFARHFGRLPPTGLSVFLEPGSDADAVRAAITAALPPGRRIHVYTNAGLRSEVLRIFDATFAITYALELIAIFIAIMGVAGTLVTLIIERRRELAVLRLVGAERRQVRRMVILEALMMGGVSQAIGLAVGVLLSLVLIYVVNLQSFGWTILFRVPVVFLAQMTVVILVATALAGLLPARHATRIPVARQVTDE